MTIELDVWQICGICKVHHKRGFETCEKCVKIAIAHKNSSCNCCSIVSDNINFRRTLINPVCWQCHIEMEQRRQIWE